MPESTPVAVSNVTPPGNVPVIASVGIGVPVTVTLNVPADRTVKVVALALVIAGATGVAVGVTLTVPDAAPMPTALVALTEQRYIVPLVNPLTVIGDVPPLPVPLGVQVAV